MTDSSNNVSASLEALNSRYDAITNNLANSSTPAFKRQRVSFKQVMAATAGTPGAPPPEPKVAARPYLDFTQGAMEQTDRPLDLAIAGKGFFTLETPAGVLYTRGGSLMLNANRQLVNASGQTVAGASGPIVLPPSSGPADVHVTADGNVQVGGASIGKLKIVDFANPADLTPVGAGLYRAPSSAATVPVTGAVRQGSRELSNVNVAQELVDLINVTRLYEANTKNISGTDERLKTLLQVAMS